MVVADYAWFQGLDALLVLEQHLTLKDARVLTHDAEVLVLGYLVDPHVEAFGDGDLVGFYAGLAPGSLGLAPIVKEPGGMYVSLSRMLFVTCLDGGDGWHPEQQTAATRSKMKTSSEEWRIGRTSGEGAAGNRVAIWKTPLP